MTIRHQEFLRELQNTNYPFAPTATRSNGVSQLAQTVFSDCTFYPAASVGNLFLSRVVVAPSEIQLVIGDLQTSDLLVGRVTTPLTSSRVTLRDAQNRPAGLIMSDPTNLGILFALGIGTHSFTRQQTEFCASCYVPLPAPPASGFVLPDGEVVSGEVWLVGSDGVVVRAIPDGGETAIRIDMVGDPLFLQRLCGGVEFNPTVPVRRIRVVNGVEGTPPEFECQATPTGNFSLQMNNALVENTALRLHTTSDGVVIEVAGSSL
jgi:hypothetical protein